ncbi:MAG: efflux RND transporter periplasmic adaptor subunit [Lachnospiraceae bacterium]|nr:efflux RND transporter periplasmic adaptor subunit [Lachnospiraceae bacterium]
MRTRNRRIAAAMAALLIAAASFAGCSKKTEETKVQLTRVETQTAARGTLEITGTYIGTVAPHNSVNVTPLVAGTVKKVNVKVGDKVKAGDVLCQFDDKAAQLQLQSAQDAVNSARAGKEAAEDQINAAKKQAEASITSMEGQLETLYAQKEASEEQLEQLEDSLDDLQKAMDAAQEGYAAAKKIYDSANALYIQYQAFLSANPDCATTAGLMAASVPIPPTVPTKIEMPASDSALGGATSEPETKDSGTDNAAETAQADQAAVEKQQAAALLVAALNEIPLTVEYLTEAGLNTLKDQAEQAQSASAAASSGFAQTNASITQLKNAIAQLEAQIQALEDNIDAAEDAKDAAGGTDAYDAQIKAAQTGVESAQYQKDLYTVTAPIDGVIESVNVAANEISAQGYPAFTISDKETMEVSFFVPEEVRDYLRPGDQIHVETPSGDVKGRISLIGTAVDPQKGLFKVTAEITTVTDKSLLSNTSVSLSLVTNSVKDQILIPFDAVYYDNDQAYVFVAEKGTEGDRAVRRDVTAGAYNNEMIAILEGLSDGDQVITTWGAGLKDGAPIEIIHPQTDNQS